MEISIQELTKLAHVTSRTLRHYDAVGVLRPSRTDHSGRRFYGEAELVRLQRILVLRGLGVPLAAIAETLRRGPDDVAALTEHLRQLHLERARLNAQIVAVTDTIRSRSTGEPLMTSTMFSGFDHGQYEKEVRSTWGDDAWQRADHWWRDLDAADRNAFLAAHESLQDDYDAAITRGESATSPQVQQIAARHAEWIAAGWQGKRPDAAALRGLAEMYVADERFAANYTRAHPHGAQFVRDALCAFADSQ